MQARHSAIVVGCLLYATALTVLGQDGLAGLTDEISTQFGAYMVLAVRILAGAAILGVIYIILTSFMGARRDGEYGVVIVPVLMGSAVLIVLGFLFAEAETAVQAIGVD